MEKYGVLWYKLDVFSGVDLMEFLSDIFIPACSAAVGFVISWFIFKQGQRYNVDRERFEKVVYPLYISLEPYLFKYDTSDDFHKAIENAYTFIHENRFLVGNILHNNFMYFFDKLGGNYKDKKKSNSFNYFSNELIIIYNKLSKNIGLENITVFYRLKHKLFSKKTLVIQYIWLFIQMLMYLILIVLSFALAIFGFYIIYKRVFN